MPWDDDLSLEQRDIITDPARLKVVRAAPGSGKTRLFVGTLRHTLESWTARKAGVAALSYTNIAQQEIVTRAGALSAPHLAITIDSFILRFLIRPFGHLVTNSPHGIRLLPAAIARHYNEVDVQIGTENSERSNLSDITYVAMDEHGQIQMTGKTAFAVAPVHEQQRTAVLRMKERLWRRSGLVTHSDTHLIAYRLLCEHAHRDAIASLVAQRLPVILVDEYQDTNYFLACVIGKLLAQPTVRGLVVGDTDQAIFEFGGAHPRLFDDLEAQPGAKSFGLPKTYRCSNSVANIASLLSCSQSIIEPTQSVGRTILIAHDDNPAVLSQSFAAELIGKETIAILARKGKTLEALKGYGKSRFPGGCKLADQLSAAVAVLPTSVSKAGQLTSSALSSLLLNDFKPTKKVLERHNTTLRHWRQAVWYLLSTAAQLPEGETWAAWVLRLRKAVLAAAALAGIHIDSKTVNKALMVKANMGKARVASQQPTSTEWPEDAVFSTIHGVKGDEFDVVALYYPKPHTRNAPCITTQWWDDQAQEERRVAFVAASRAKRVFILCVHRETYAKLEATQQVFFAAFSERIPPLQRSAGPKHRTSRIKVSAPADPAAARPVS